MSGHCSGKIVPFAPVAVIAWPKVTPLCACLRTLFLGALDAGERAELINAGMHVLARIRRAYRQGARVREQS